MQKICLFLFLLVGATLHTFGQCAKLTGTHTATNGAWTPPASPIVMDVEVPSGITCTISSVTRTFGKNVKITVKAGGTLILDNVQFTACDTSIANYWTGIIIEGTRNQPQVTADTSAFTTHQGRVVIRNSSSISCATIGVQVGISSTSSQNGGVLRCVNSKFYNCKKAVLFYPYAGYANFSYFAKDSFIWDKFVQTDGRYDSVYHVKLDNVKGVYFHNGNVFINKMTFVKMADRGIREFRFSGIGMESPRGIGILSSEATFYLKRGGPCYSLINSDVSSTCIYCHGDKNLFEGLGFGIAVIGASNRDAIITGCKFLNNWNGVRATEVDRLFINRNDFVMDDSIKRYFDYGKCTAVFVTNQTQALGGTSTHKIEISENNIDFLVTRIISRTSYSNLTCGDDAVYGILFIEGSANNNATDDLIYHNWINMALQPALCNTDVFGIGLKGDNRKLRIECNNFDLDPSWTKEDTINGNFLGDDNYYDIGTRGEDDMMRSQGSSVKEAGNVFSPNCGQVYSNTSIPLGYLWHIHYTAEPSAPGITYHYFTPTSTKEPVCKHDPNSKLTKSGGAGYNTCTFSAFCHFFDTSENISGHTAISGVGTGTGDDDPIVSNNMTDRTDDDWEKGLQFPSGDTLVRHFDRSNQVSESGGGVAKIYNPDQEVRTYYTLKEIKGPSTLLIYDLTGRKVGSYLLSADKGQIELPHKNGAIYIYQIYSQGLLVQSGKLFVK